MAGTELVIDLAALDGVNANLQALPEIIGILPEGIAGVLESQTRRRISVEKSGPDGTDWAAWSPDYAETRGRGKSLLQSSGELLDSIAGFAEGDAAIVGTDKIYGGIHQWGGADEMPAGPAAIPARPFLGVSGENVEEIVSVVNAAISDHLGGARGN